MFTAVVNDSYFIYFLKIIPEPVLQIQSHTKC